MRTKKIFLNMISDVVSYLIIGIVGLVKVNFLINYIGDIGNGYYQTINQIITYVFLAQIGFGDAVIFSLYKHFADKDKKDINRVYTGSRKIFKKIGLVILAIIFIVSLFLYLFYGFEDGYRNTSLFAFIVISCSYLISYFGCGQTYLSVLSASQNKYIYSLIFNSIKLLCDISIIIVSYKFGTLESIAIVILIAKIIEEIILRIVMKKKFSWLHEVKKEDTSMFKMTYDLAGATIGNLILNNIDYIIIILFLGPVQVSIYSSYIFITRYLIEISSKVEVATVNSFGEIFAKNEENKIYPLFKELLVLFIIISFAFILTFNIGIRGFINLWIGKENYLLPYKTVFLFGTVAFLRIISLPLLTLIKANGYFKENKNHIFISVIINIILSLLLVKIYGLNGLLFGTLISYLVNLFLKISLVENKIFKKLKHKSTYIYYIVILISFIILNYIIKFLENSIFLAMNNLTISVLLLGLIFISIILLSSGLFCGISESARNLFERLKRIIKRK